MTLTQKIKNNYLDVLFSALALICVIALYVVFAVVSPTDFSRKGNIAYFVLCAVPLILVGVFGIRSMKEKSLFQKLIFVLILSPARIMHVFTITWNNMNFIKTYGNGITITRQVKNAPITAPKQMPLCVAVHGSIRRTNRSNK